MKKILVYVMLVCLLMLSGCSFFDTNEKLNVKDLKTDTLSSKNKVISKSNAIIVDSYYDEFENWYYTVEIGALTNVPLQNMNNTGMIRWTQNATSYTKTVTTSITESTSMKEMLENQAKDVVSSETENKISAEIGAEFTRSFDYFGLAQKSWNASINVAYDHLWKNSASHESQYASSFEQASSKTKTETVSETIVFDSSCPTGYYGWNLCGNLKVYAFIVFNPIAAKFNVTYITDIVATYWSFDYLTDEEFNNISLGYEYESALDFDMPKLEQPTKFFNVTEASENQGKNLLNVVLDGNGGYCNNTLMIYQGNKYGELPVPTYNMNYYFAGWEDPHGNIVTNDTICNYGEDHTLKAKWGKAVFSQSFGSAVINEGKLDVEVGKIELDIDKEALIAAGYTAYRVTVEFNIKSNATLYDIPDAIYTNYIMTDISLGGVELSAPRAGKHYSFDFTKNGSGLFSVNSMVDGKNTFIIQYSNANLEVFRDYSVTVTGLKVTITFYNPNN